MKQGFESIRTGIEMGLLAVLNPIFFRLRSAIRFRRSGYAEEPEPLEEVSEDLRESLTSPRADQLRERYDLGRFEPKLRRESFLSVLYFADLLDSIFESSRLLGETRRPNTDGRGPENYLRILDIGSKNFECAPAMVSVAGRRLGHGQAGGVTLTGIELDAFRIYRNFHSRADVGHYFSGLAGEANQQGSKSLTRSHQYIAGDLLEHEGAYDLITWFHPFLNAYPLLHWGLPKGRLRPGELFDHALGLLAPGGRCVILNQEEHERDTQRALLEAKGAEFEAFEITLAFRGEERTGYVFVLSRA